MKKKVFWFLASMLVVLLIVFVFGTKKAPPETKTDTTSAKQYDKLPQMQIDTAKQYQVVIETDKDTIKAELFAKEVPVTVNNFVFLAKEGFYNGVKFHRIVKGFMVQTGDPKGDGTGGPGYTFEDEKITRDYTRGTLAMANSGPNTNGSQFFIVHQDYDLPKQYVIFGAIDPEDKDSLAALDAIAETKVGKNAAGEESSPTEEALIKTITVEEK